MADELMVTGVQDVLQMFGQLPVLLQGEVLYKALDRAAGIVAAEVEIRAPEGEYEELKDGVIVVTGVGIDGDQKGGTSLVGFSSDLTQGSEVPLDVVAYWIEFGHEMVTHKPALKKVGHVPAAPFIRPAFDASADRAMEVFAEVVIDGLTGGNL